VSSASDQLCSRANRRIGRPRGNMPCRALFIAAARFLIGRSNRSIAQDGLIRLSCLDVGIDPHRVDRAFELDRIGHGAWCAPRCDRALPQGARVAWLFGLGTTTRVALAIV